MKTKGIIILALCSILPFSNMAAQDDLWGGVALGNRTSHSNTATQNNKSNLSMKNSQSQNEDYGSSPVHGKIIKKESSDDGVQHNDYTYYADGYVSCVGRRPCTICNASGKCSVCYGTGVGSFNYPCYMCTMNRGKCSTCYGTGQFVVSTGYYLNNNSSGSYSGGASGSYSNGSSAGSGSSNGSSVYTKCTSCNGTGRCSSCNGRGYKFNSYSGHDDSCPSCRGKGSCPICYGRGKL